MKWSKIASYFFFHAAAADYFDEGLTPAHIPRTETQVKKIVSDIPPHTNQNIGIG